MVSLMSYERLPYVQYVLTGILRNFLLQRLEAYLGLPQDLRWNSL